MKHLKLFLALFALVGVNLTANAQTDVTADYVVNPGFEDCTARTDNLAASGSASGDNYADSGWTLAASAAWSSSAVVAYGGSGQVNGASAPSADNAGNSGKTLGVSVGWGGTNKYQSTTAVTLPAGHYELKVYAYNNLSGANQFQSVFGFVPTSGSSYLSTKKSYTYGTWEADVVTFDLTEATEGKFQIGGTAISGGSGSNAKVFFDNITLTYTDPLQAAKSALQAEIDKAELCDEKEGLADAIAAAKAVLTNATTEQELADALATLQAADKDAVLRYENGFADATATNGMLTTFVVNGTFDSNVNGWQHVAEVWSNNIASNQQGDFTGNFYENWDQNAKVNKMYQAINNIPNGTYKLKIAAFVNNLADPNESQYVFANNDKTYLTTGSPTFYEVWTVVENNTVEIGLEQTTATANWMGIDNVSLTYYGAGDVISQAQNAGHKADWDAALAAARDAVGNTDYDNVTGQERTDLNAEIAKPEPTTAEGYDEATAALVNATNAFTTAKLNYDALVAEIAKAKALGIDAETADGYAATEEATAATALTNTQNLKVEEYNYVTTAYQYGVELGEWTSTGKNTKAADFTGQHWSGPTAKYKNQDDNNGQGWNAGSWEIHFSQNVKLPAGNYVFKVAGRQASGNQVNTELVVKLGETELGSVNDFPRSNNSRGINLNGETAFEGDNSEFANNGNGYGWEWRYVKFTLAEDATVNIAINSVATASQQWVSFGDYTVQTDNEANISLIAYNVALNSAKTVRDDEVYTNVTGSEQEALLEAIAADNDLNKSDKTAVDAAKTALETAISVFTAAKDAYDGLAAINETITNVGTLTYADPNKKPAAFTVTSETTAAIATTQTAILTTALRLYYESNALAEGVEGAVDMTDKVNNPLFEDGLNNWESSQGGGNLNVNTNESFTDGSGKNDYKYYDYYNGDANNQDVHQTIEGLEPGTYILTVTARAATTLTDVRLYAGSAQIVIPRKGNSGETFDRGWNDVTLEFQKSDSEPINIKVASNPSGGNHGGWFGFTRVRLVKIAGTVPISVTTAGLATFSCDKALDFTKAEKIAAYTATVSGTDIALTKVTKVPANTGLLIRSLAGGEANEDILVALSAEPIENNALVATTESMNDAALAGKYILANGSKGVGFYKAGSGASLKAGQAYLEAGTSAKAFFAIEGVPTGINAVENADADTNVIYNLSGQRVNNAFKGIVIKNGKKVLVK